MHIFPPFADTLKSRPDVVDPVLNLKRYKSGSFSGGHETAVYSRIAMQKATAIRPKAKFFLLPFGAKPQNYGLVLACFSLLCDPGAINLSRVAYHIESEKHAVSSPTLSVQASFSAN